jgi:uncharacterized membrane protein YgcG
MSALVADSAVGTDRNSLNAWAIRFELPLSIVEVFQDNALSTVEDVGKAWCLNYQGVGKLLQGYVKVNKERLESALEYAEDYYRKKQVFADEPKPEEEDKVDSPSKPTDSPSPRDFERDSHFNRLKIGQKSHSGERPMDIDPESPRESPPSRQSSGKIAEGKVSSPIAYRKENKESTSPRTSFEAKAPSPERVPEQDLIDWIPRAKLPPEILDEFTASKLFSCEAVANAPEDLILSFAERLKLKPIPKKKYLDAIKELRVSLTASTETPPSVAHVPPPSSILPASEPLTVYHHPREANNTPLVEEEGMIMGDMVLILTEREKEIDVLKKQLEHENSSIENLIQLTCNSSDRFSEKALEIINQSKRDHQERAKRIKKLIQVKKAAVEAMAPAGTDIEGEKAARTVTNLTRGTSGTENPEVAAVGDSSSKRLVFVDYVFSHSIVQSIHWKDIQNAHQSVERLKDKDEFYLKPDDFKAPDHAKTVKNSSSGVSSSTPAIPGKKKTSFFICFPLFKINFLFVLEKPKKDSSSEGGPNWKCNVCQRINSLDISKCPDCFSDRQGRTAASELYKSNTSGRNVTRSGGDYYGWGGFGFGGGSGGGGGSSSSFFGTSSSPAAPSVGKNFCRKCTNRTNKAFFCERCAVEHEKKIGHHWNGDCAYCKDCGDLTMNVHLCDDCEEERKKMKQKQQQIAGLYMNCSGCRYAIPINCTKCPYCNTKQL